LGNGYHRVTRKDDDFLELKKVNKLFNDCYKLYKTFSQTSLTENDLDEFVRETDLIYKKYNNKFSKELLLAVINEVDRLERTKSA